MPSRSRAYASRPFRPSERNSRPSATATSSGPIRHNSPRSSATARRSRRSSSNATACSRPSPSAATKRDGAARDPGNTTATCRTVSRSDRIAALPTATSWTSTSSGSAEVTSAATYSAQTANGSHSPVTRRTRRRTLPHFACTGSAHGIRNVSRGSSSRSSRSSRASNSRRAAAPSRADDSTTRTRRASSRVLIRSDNASHAASSDADATRQSRRTFVQGSLPDRSASSTPGSPTSARSTCDSSCSSRADNPTRSRP